jgi:hypothetical protein
MRKKRSSKRRISGVRRKRSMIGAIDPMNILSVVGGAVIAGMVNKLLPSDSTLDPKIVAGGKVALGIALPMLSKDGKMKNILGGVGAGMIAVGSVDLLKAMSVISGDFDIPVINGDVLAGDVLAGLDIPVINGDDMMSDDTAYYM